MTTFQLDTSIRFGANALEALDKHRDQRVFLVTDPFLASTDLFRKARARLGSQVTVFDEVEPNPTVALVGRGTTCYLKADPEVVVALGGGSPIDAAKAMHQAALEVGRAAQHGLVVVPTTSGSGSEVTSFSVITDEVTHAKIAMVSPAMRPAVAILDPRAVLGVPPKVTADAGMDVLTHGLEAYVATNASDFSDAFAEKSVRMVFESLARCYGHGSDLDARERMHNASTLAALAFDHAGLGIVHSLSHALGGRYPVAHGRINALLLPHVMAFNAAESPKVAARYARLARLMGMASGSTKAGVLSLIGAVERLRSELDMPARISEAGVSVADLQASTDDIATTALNDRCTPTNPVQPTTAQLTAILRQIL
ncbi:1-propanol dehydrogenase PduQ [Tessaracoccus sp. Z1128]